MYIDELVVLEKENQELMKNLCDMRRNKNE